MERERDPRIVKLNKLHQGAFAHINNALDYDERKDGKIRYIRYLLHWSIFCMSDFLLFPLLTLLKQTMFALTEDNAILEYKKGLNIMEEALKIAVNDSDCSGKDWDKARSLYAKMESNRTNVKGRLEKLGMHYQMHYEMHHPDCKVYYSIIERKSLVFPFLMFQKLKSW